MIVAISTVIQFVLPGFLMTLALWRGAWMLYGVAGLSWLLYSFNYWTTSSQMSWIFILLALICFAGAIWDRR
jgi:hypothetical protein